MPRDRPIVHVLPAEPFGGLQGLVIELARVQRSIGKDVDLILLGESARVESRCREAGIEPIVMRGSKLSRMATLLAELRRRPHSVFHSHCEPIWASIILALLRPLWMVHLHVYARRKNMRDRAGHWIHRVFARRFVAITRSVAESFSRANLAPHARLSVVYNGMDPTTVPLPEERRPVANPFTVAFVGRAVREKGLFDFIEVADRLRDTPGLRFIIAGEGADLAEARDVIATRGLESRISVLGFVGDMKELWRGIDMLLMLSSREPFGLVILEAIASGAAVLGYETESGGSEIMSCIAGCRMVPAFSIDALAEAVVLASRDETLRAAVADGRSMIIDRFSLDRMEAELATEYRRI